METPDFRPPSDDAAADAFPPLLLVGTDFRLSPLALRERVAYDARGAEELLVHLLAREAVAEASVLSTCNRTEVYVVPRHDEGAHRGVIETAFLAKEPEIERDGRLYVRREAAAARHLLRVAAGLESMVLGEPEILGQVRQAHELAEAVGSSGPLTRRLLRAAAETGRRARSETAISTGAVSLGYTVVELAKNIFSDLSEAGVLVLGAGETARQVVRNLVDRGGARRVQVANRSRERARRLADELPQVEVLPLEERYAALEAADVVVATTSAEQPLLGVERVREALARRRARPLLAVDLGVPRNVEEAVGRLPNVFLHTIDSLDVLIQRNLKRRREEVPKVEEIVEQELARFTAWYRGLAAEPLIARLQKQAEEVRRRELAQALSRFPVETHDDLDRLTRSLVRKILHHPSSSLRGRGADSGESIERLDLVRELFRLDDDEPA
jgi:glutamyl-tRNA reductase